MVISVLRMKFGKRRLDSVLRRLEQDALPPVQHIGRLLRQRLVRPHGERVDVGQRTDVGRRALQHRHMARARIGQGRNQSHRGGTAADDDDLLARVVEVLRPVLRVNDRALEVLRAGELRRVALVVVVVAAAGEQEEQVISTSSPPRSTRPSSGSRRPTSRRRTTFWPYRMCLSMPYSATVSFR